MTAAIPPRLGALLLALGVLLAVSPGAGRAAPDLVPEVFAVDVAVRDVLVGDVIEGCAGGQSARVLVRFSIRSRNVGLDDLVLGDPQCPNCQTNPGATCGNPLFVCSAAHGHAHFESFVDAVLLDEQGMVVAEGHKAGFCLLDGECAAPQYNCAFQGISAGCADVYHAGLPCQYVDITDASLAAGDYVLRVTIDPDDVLAEANEGNNTVEVPVHVGGLQPVCPVHAPADLPQAIPDAGLLTSTLAVPLDGTVEHVNIVGLEGSHTRMSDLEVHLVSPLGTDVVVMDRVCGNADGFDLDLSDGAAPAIACPPASGLAFRPSMPLGAFQGEVAGGTWTLRVFDRAAGVAGTLDGWSLEVCVEAHCPVYQATDVPLVVPDEGSVVSSVVAPSALVSDVSVIGLLGTHTAVGDLELQLGNPHGTTVTVMDRVCGTDDDFALDLDDAALSAIPCPPTDGMPHLPSNAFPAFKAEDAAGAWTLTVLDHKVGDVGTLDGWGVQICGCGTGTIDPGETCDDGNQVGGDGCDPTCQVEPCARCFGEPSACVPDRGCLKCARVIAKESAKLTAARAKALTQCELARVQGKHADPCPDPDGLAHSPGRRAADRIERAVAKVRARVDKACGGADAICGGDPTDEIPPRMLGFAPICPGLTGTAAPACSAALGDCGAVVDCLACVSEAGVARVVARAFGDLKVKQPTTSRTLARCRETVGKETTSRLMRTALDLQKCWDARLRGKHADACPDAAGGAIAARTASRIARAAERQQAKICRACGGADRACGGGDDVDPVADVGFAAACDAVTVPGGDACTGAIASLEDLVACVGCVDDFAATCVDAVQIPAYVAYPAACAP